MTPNTDHPNTFHLPTALTGTEVQETHSTSAYLELEREYLRRIEKLIKTRWQAPKTNTVLQTQVVFRVTRDGRIAALHLSKSSGSAQMDSSALQAVERSDALPLIPHGLPERYDLQMTFQTNTSRIENEEQVRYKALTPPKRLPSSYVPSLSLPQMISPPPPKRFT